MIHLESFSLPTDETEDIEFTAKDELGRLRYLKQFTDKDNLYPWRFFYNRKPEDATLDFDDITLFYGGNGSGKSTLLNLISEKLNLPRINMFNYSPTFDYYIQFCEAELAGSDSRNPLSPIRNGKIIASDDIFANIIAQREKELKYENERLEMRNRLRDYRNGGHPTRINFETGEGVADARECYSTRHGSLRNIMRSRITEVLTRSNGENAFDFFVDEIKPNTLVLLDEPENSLSARWQKELASFIHASAIADHCQFIISTHSPFMLAIPDAKIYNLDTPEITTSQWTELENVRLMYDLFKENERAFQETQTTQL